MMDLKAYPILYVDDEKPNRTVIKHNLRNRYKLFIASSGEEALEIIRQQNIAVLLTDQRMPGMTGVDLAEAVSHIEPDIIRIIITAYADLDATVDAINRGRVSRFIHKPWTIDVVNAVLQESIHTYHNHQLAKQFQVRLFELERVAGLAIAAAGVTHDLRNANAVISPNLELLQEIHQQLQEHPELEASLQPLVKEASEVTMDVQAGFKMLERLLNTLLQTTRTQEMTLLEIFDAVEIAHNALLLTRNAIIRAGRLRCDIPDTPLYLEGSPHRLLQLFNNLLLNAVQALDKEKRSTNYVKIAMWGTAEHLYIEIADSGSGIPAEILPNIFKAFYTTKGKQGSGLGLAICKQVAEEFGGTIDIQSTPGEGTQFIIKLPRKPAPQTSNTTEES